MRWITVLVRKENAVPEAIVFNSTHIDQIIEALGGEILMIAKKEEGQKARLYADGFNDGIQEKPPKLAYPSNFRPNGLYRKL